MVMSPDSWKAVANCAPALKSNKMKNLILYSYKVKFASIQR
jgi:hypothetical protein